MQVLKCRLLKNAGFKNACFKKCRFFFKKQVLNELHNEGTDEEKEHLHSNKIEEETKLNNKTNEIT